MGTFLASPTLTIRTSHPQKGVQCDYDVPRYRFESTP